MEIKIKHKLFFTLLFTSFVVASGMFLFMQWSFDRGFLNYVNTQELEQLDELAERLTVSYGEHDNWRFLMDNNTLWGQLQRNSALPSQSEWRNRPPPPPHWNEAGTGEPPFRPETDPNETLFRHQSNRDLFQPERFPPPPPPPEPGNQRGVAPRIVLFDAEKKKIIGGPYDMKDNLSLHPFTYQGEVIGYLGLIPAKELSDAGDLLFVEQQTESIALVALIMMVLSLLLSFPITNHLLRPIKALTEGTRKLISGQFKNRIPITSKDELGQLSYDFNSLAMTLEENERSRQQWVADISHELRTPLAVLRGEIEALQDGVRQSGPKALESLHGETMRLERLVNDLYELSMSDIGALNYKKVKVDPVGVLEETLELFGQRFTQKGLTLTTQLQKNLSFSLLADPDRLQQLFTNLLENCMRYTDSPGQIDIQLEHNRSAMIFHFQDSAPGVPSPSLKKLFDRLYRVAGSRSHAQKGGGLGMAICKNIVEAHQGRIAASHSKLGGLWVRIELPIEFTN